MRSASSLPALAMLLAAQVQAASHGQLPGSPSSSTTSSASKVSASEGEGRRAFRFCLEDCLKEHEAETAKKGVGLIDPEARMSHQLNAWEHEDRIRAHFEVLKEQKPLDWKPTRIHYLDSGFDRLRRVHVQTMTTLNSKHKEKEEDYLRRQNQKRAAIVAKFVEMREPERDKAAVAAGATKGGGLGGGSSMKIASLGAPRHPTNKQLPSHDLVQEAIEDGGRFREHVPIRVVHGLNLAQQRQFDRAFTLPRPRPPWFVGKDYEPMVTAEPWRLELSRYPRKSKVAGRSPPLSDEQLWSKVQAAFNAPRRLR